MGTFLVLPGLEILHWRSTDDVTEVEYDVTGLVLSCDPRVE